MIRLFDRLSAGRCVAPVLVLLFAILVFDSAVSAQVRPRQDTTAVRTDSLRVDSIAGDTLVFAEETATTARVLAPHARGAESSFATAIWEWDREDLLREGALSLSDLLERVPGLITYRPGTLLQPEVISAYGGTRNSYDVVIDGYILDPLVEPTYEFSRLALAELSHVRVVRRLDVTRVEVRTYAATEGVAESRVEAGVGEPDTNLFRGMLLSPRFLVGPLGLAIERLDTDGTRGTQPADAFSGWVKWAWIRGESGIQAEFRRNTVTRHGTSPWISEGRREDLVLRGRLGLARGLVAEAFGGHSTFELDTLSVSLPEDSIRPAKLEQSVTQFGGRLSYQNDFAWVDATVRGRDTDLLPAFQVDLAAGGRLGGIGEANAYFTQANWENGSAASYTIRAIGGPFYGLRPFVELFGGDHGARVHLNQEGAFFTHRSGSRTGLEFNRWGVQLGAAILGVESDSLLSFGLPFDTTSVGFPGGSLSGWEFAGRAQLYFPWLFADGSYTNWLSGTSWIYMPTNFWRAGLELHALPLESGNLEIYGRIGMRHRSAVTMPAAVENTETGEIRFEPVIFPGYDVVDGYLQIRVMSVRLFLRGDNLLNAEYFDSPQLPIRGPRIYYGVKWDFRS